MEESHLRRKSQSTFFYYANIWLGIGCKCLDFHADNFRQHSSLQQLGSTQINTAPPLRDLIDHNKSQQRQNTIEEPREVCERVTFTIKKSIHKFFTSNEIGSESAMNA